MDEKERGVLALLFWCALIFLWLHSRRQRQLSQTAHGTARWCSDTALRAAGMLAGRGLILGRTLSGALIRLPTYTHVLLVGGTGSGKGIGFVIPNMLTYFTGSVVCFDIKGDICCLTARIRQRLGQQIRRLAPFNHGVDSFNPLDCIPNDERLLDNARALADSLVVRTGMEHDMHWADRAVDSLTALLVYVLLAVKDAERNLNTVAEVASNPKMIFAIAHKLIEIGNLSARLGNQLLALFDKDGTPTKEGAGVLSTMTRHLSFLTSPLVAKAVAYCTFDPYELLKPGITLYIQIPPEMLDSHKALLRCWTTALMRVIGVEGQGSEVLFLCDEASALNNLPSLEEALVRGRSGGVRLALIYQSCSQVEASFKDKKTLIYDNCATHVFLKPSSYETAERISKSLGQYTEEISSYGTNNGRSWQELSFMHNQQQQQGANVNSGNSENRSVIGRHLMRPEEILSMDQNLLICLTYNTAPILARRIKYYADSAFTQVKAAVKPGNWREYVAPMWLMLTAMGIGLLLWALFAP